MSKLREAVLAVVERWESPKWAHDAPHTGALISALREALREDALEYELIGTIDGTYVGQWMLAVFAENASAVWPDGTAIYVRRIRGAGTENRGGLPENRGAKNE